ncbi:MAG TPA: ATP-binding cassette domain-containing protein [Candidatus Didemnitutus sp.]|jgi:ABC-type transporter Mla maintaining outer membrane lipid asymmetry ATPase subunit MlaF
MIEIDDLEGAHFQLAHVAVPAGEMAAIVAPTAACAREFVDFLLGLALPQRGTVRLLGEALATLTESSRRALRSRLGFAAQADGLVGHLALWENILLGPAYHRGCDAASLEARMRQLLSWCGWTGEDAREALLRKPDHATPFERAAAAWMRALLVDPDLLVCEDLFAGLAAEERRRLIEGSVSFQAESPTRAAVFVLVGDRLLDELQPTQVTYLSLRGDFRAESQT